ncbi:MAG TPA: phosphatidylglycerophosphatase A [Candidatus Polarisedimenticolia bacterium]|nr:phosphatidylglycerophosphatase A [Candidatus Polarisedimenticolia bacterium]
MRAAAWLTATFFGVGRFPVASGTVATAAAIPFYLGAWSAGGHLLVLVLALVLSAAGVAAAAAAETRLGYHDPSEVVIDEVAGFFVTMLFVPPTVWTCTAGFFIFRALDVLKPWPASRAEKLPGGWGIMADDLICGMIGNLLIHLALWGLGFWR